MFCLDPLVSYKHGEILAQRRDCVYTASPGNCTGERKRKTNQHFRSTLLGTYRTPGAYSLGHQNYCFLSNKKGLLKHVKGTTSSVSWFPQWSTSHLWESHKRKRHSLLHSDFATQQSHVAQGVFNLLWISFNRGKTNYFFILCVLYGIHYAKMDITF